MEYKLPIGFLMTRSCPYFIHQAVMTPSVPRDMFARKWVSAVVLSFCFFKCQTPGASNILLSLPRHLAWKSSHVSSIPHNLLPGHKGEGVDLAAGKLSTSWKVWICHCKMLVSLPKTILHPGSDRDNVLKRKYHMTYIQSLDLLPEAHRSQVRNHELASWLAMAHQAKF